MAPQLEDDFSERLAEFGQRLEQKQRDLERHGLLHGDVRQAAIDMEMRQVRLQAMAHAKQLGSSRAQWLTTLASEFSALRFEFDRWLASIDRGH